MALYSFGDDVLDVLAAAGLLDEQELLKARATLARYTARENDLFDERIVASNLRAEAAYDRLPPWRKLLAGFNRSEWVCRHRDYLPL